MPTTFLTAEWRKLIMAQYAVAPETLAPWLPRGVELDLFQGRCYVSLIGFLFDRVRVLGLPIPLHTRFEEVNLRFYVARSEPDGTRKRGVVFIREFVPRAAIALLANSLYEEPYATLPMRRNIAAKPEALSVSYRWRYQGTWHSLAVEADPVLQPIAAGSEEEFITEHYWGYTKRRNGSTGEYGVAHPRWQIYPLHSAHIQADFGSLYGPQFAPLSDRIPDHVLLAEGSPIAIRSGSHFRA
jgi:uncharacterized protein YqjF (DUF2071 family)